MTAPRYTLSDESVEITKALAENFHFGSSKHTLSVFINIIYSIGLKSVQEKLFDLNGIFLGEPLLNCLMLPDDFKAALLENPQIRQALENTISRASVTQKQSSTTRVKKQVQKVQQPSKAIDEIKPLVLSEVEVAEAEPEPDKQVSQNFKAAFWEQFKKK